MFAQFADQYVLQFPAEVLNDAGKQIMSEWARRFDSSDTPVYTSCFEEPNDNGKCTITFDFLAPVRTNRIDLADIDPGAPNSSQVVLTDDQGRKRTFTVPAGWTEDLVNNGPPGFRTLDLGNTSPQPGFTANATSVSDAGFDRERVVKLEVRFGSSGACDNLCFCP